jgi:hypothetical protein
MKNDLFEQGDKIKTPYGGEAMTKFHGKQIFKKCVLDRYCKGGRTAIVIHTNSVGKQRQLKRKVSDIFLE